MSFVFEIVSFADVDKSPPFPSVPRCWTVAVFRSILIGFDFFIKPNLRSFSIRSLSHLLGATIRDNSAYSVLLTLTYL